MSDIDSPDIQRRRLAWHYSLWNRILFVGCVGVTLLLSLSTVTESGLTLPFARRPLPEMCALRAATGADCSSCGITRSCATLLQGDWQRSLKFHRFGWLLVGFLLAQLLLRGVFSLVESVRYWKCDACATSALFVACFAPFLWN